MSSNGDGRPLHYSQPYHRTIFAVDIEGSTTRNNMAKAGLRDDMYRMVEVSLESNGIPEDYRDPLVDRGDGILTMIHPQVPKPLLLGQVVPTLHNLLAERARTADQPGQHLRLRVVVHAGEVHSDERGYFGEALDDAFRLLDAPEVKQTFRMSESPMLLVVSDLIHRSIVMQGYPGIDPATFIPLVDVPVGGHRCAGWISLRETVAPTLVSVTDPGRRNENGKRIAHSAERFVNRRRVV